MYVYVYTCVCTFVYVYMCVCYLYVYEYIGFWGEGKMPLQSWRFWIEFAVTSMLKRVEFEALNIWGLKIFEFAITSDGDYWRV